MPDDRVRLRARPVEPSYGATLVRPADLIDRLRDFCASGHHRFWPDAVSLADHSLFVPNMIRGHRQATDIYLLGLATFDRSVPPGAVVGATAATLAVIGPADPD